MEQQQNISIRVTIADRSYQLNINPADEEVVRLAANKLNEKTLIYKKRYPGKDTQDILALASLQFVSMLIETEKNELAGLEGGIDAINRQLENYLQQSNVNI